MNPELMARAARIRMLLMDVDGVLTNAKLYNVPGPDGKMWETKGFDAQDGIALQWMSWYGIETGVISGRVSPAVEERARQVKMTHVYQGHIEKIPILEQICAKSGIPADAIAYIGDDLTDVVVMHRVSLGFAPANARPEVKKAAHFVTAAAGGAGAVREVCELLLQGAREVGGDSQEIRDRMRLGIEIAADAGPGILHETTGVIARHQGNILSVEIMEERPEEARTYFEIELPGDAEALLRDLGALPVVHHVKAVDTMEKIYGKRIIIMGGGAQVGQVALGAITEADRHNIRGRAYFGRHDSSGGRTGAGGGGAGGGSAAAREGAGAGGVDYGRRDRKGGAGCSRAGVAGGEPEHGGQRSGCGRSGDHGSGAGGRDDGDGGGGYGEVYCGEVEEEGVLVSTGSAP